MLGTPADPPVPETREMSTLVLRGWLEPGAPRRLRVRVVEIIPGRSERSIIVTSSVDEVCRAVRSWLETLQGPGTN